MSWYGAKRQLASTCVLHCFFPARSQHLSTSPSIGLLLAARIPFNMQSVLRRSSVSILRARSTVLPTLISNSRPVLSSSSGLRSAFSTSIIRSKDQEANHRYTSGAWKEGKNVSYEELKPITMSPDDVSFSWKLWEELVERKEAD